MMIPGEEKYKYIDLPLANYASATYDKLVDSAGTIKVLSSMSRRRYSYNESSMPSLGYCWIRMSRSAAS